VNTQTIPTTEPFFLPGGRTGILLIHGFTGTPKEMRWMGEYLNRELGFTCLGVRLTGHATRPKDMIRSRWSDWTASVEDGYNLLRGATDDVYLVGLSMGGALSLLMSTRLDVKGIVTMSAPSRMPAKYPAWQIRLISYFKTYLPKTKGKADAGWFDKESFKGHVSYPLNPIRSAAELEVLLEKMRAALPRVKVPVCMIHSKDDDYVLPENLENIFSGLVNVSDKSKYYVTGSGHVVTRDAARGQVFEIARDFIKRVEGSSTSPWK
jgi:carboxylesterase